MCGEARKPEQSQFNLGAKRAQLESDAGSDLY
jgi:hypothetical protein